MAIEKIKIHIPVDTDATTATMYFPLNIAKQRGIFESVIGKNILVTPEGATGDSEAIKALYKPKQDDTEQDENKNILSLAIADPTALAGLYENKHTEGEDVEKIRVIGALINKLSFWAISKKKDNSCLITNYDPIIVYTAQYKTSNMIGLRLSEDKQEKEKEQKDESAQEGQDSNKGPVTPVNPGEEFEKLSEEKTLIITPDILRVAEHSTQNNVHILTSYAKNNDNNALPAPDNIDSDYITTAIFAHTDDIKDSEKRKLIVKVIKAIQKARFVLFSSDDIAVETLKSMGCITKINPQDTNGSPKYDDEKITIIAKKVVELMSEGPLYPYEMNIYRKQWRNTMAASRSTAVSALRYGQYVDNEIVIEAENALAKELGIRSINHLPKWLREVVGWIRAARWSDIIIGIFAVGVIALILYLWQKKIPLLEFVGYITIGGGSVAGSVLRPTYYAMKIRDRIQKKKRK